MSRCRKWRHLFWGYDSSGQQHLRSNSAFKEDGTRGRQASWRLINYSRCDIIATLLFTNLLFNMFKSRKLLLSKKFLSLQGFSGLFVFFKSGKKSGCPELLLCYLVQWLSEILWNMIFKMLLVQGLFKSLYTLSALTLTLAVTFLLTTQTRDVTQHPSVDPTALFFAK